MPKGYYAVGNVYFEMKQYEKVERYYIRAIKLGPRFSWRIHAGKNFTLSGNGMITRLIPT